MRLIIMAVVAIAISVATGILLLNRVLLSAEHFDAAAAVSGWLISIAGFSLTLWQLQRTQSAADAARRAARGVESAVHKYDTITEIAHAEAALRAATEYHRGAAWKSVQPEYEKAKRAYTNIRAMHVGLTSDENEALRANIEKLSEMERDVERFLLAGAEQPNAADFNVILFKQMGDLAGISANVKKTLGGEDNG
jgi:hypothetical protein